MLLMPHNTIKRWSSNTATLKFRLMLMISLVLSWILPPDRVEEVPRVLTLMNALTEEQNQEKTIESFEKAMTSAILSANSNPNIEFITPKTILRLLLVKLQTDCNNAERQFLVKSEEAAQRSSTFNSKSIVNNNHGTVNINQNYVSTLTLTLTLTHITLTLTLTINQPMSQSSGSGSKRKRISKDMSNTQVWITYILYIYYSSDNELRLLLDETPAYERLILSLRKGDWKAVDFYELGSCSGPVNGYNFL
jgi:hypothetical protein